MATFTITLTDAEKGVLEIEVTSDPKMALEDDPTVAQRLGLAAVSFMSAMTSGGKHEVIDADGAPVVKAPVQF